MNIPNAVKSALIFVGGGAVGGGLAWFFTKHHYEKTIDERVEELVRPEKEFYQNQIEEKEGKITFNAIEDENDENETENDIRSEDVTWGGEDSYTEMMNRRKAELAERMAFKNNLDRVRYDTLYKSSESISEKQEEEVDEVRLQKNDDDPGDDIYVITSEQFTKERYGFDKVTLYWWELERILSEEDYDILDVPEILGSRWEQHIGEEEQDVVYVRNESLETDYEVIVQHESFYEMRQE